MYILNNHPYFEVLSEFKGLRKPILRKCKNCGDVREVNARCLVEKDKNNNYRKCLKCVAKERAASNRKTHIQFISEMKSVNPDIEFLSEYTTTDSKITCRCLIDNTVWKAKPHTLLDGHGCPSCANRLQNRRSNDEYVREMKQKHPNIIPLDTFKGVNKRMHFKCVECGYEWTAVSNALLNKSNSDCPKCNISQGEKRISEVLDAFNISYDTEHMFDGCKDIRNLRFDFFIPSYNMCIEYDGEQHFYPVRFDKHNKKGTPEERFNKLKYRDELKTKYCEDNNISLVRIPYTDFNNIDIILSKYFS